MIAVETQAEPVAPPTPRVVRLVGAPDSHGRSLAKAVTWRAVGTADTFVWSLLITHQPVAAGTIASLETFTKIVLFYLHERLWRLFRWAPNARLRSAAKSVSWRVIGGLDTATLSFLVTGSFRYAITIAGAEAISKVALYYVHERAWRKVAWGRLDG